MKRTKDSIKKQIISKIGRVVFIALVIIGVLNISLLVYCIKSGKQTELTLESQSTAHQLSTFFRGYEKMTVQMGADPDINALLKNTKQGDSIQDVSGFAEVFDNLCSAAGTDTESILSTWVRIPMPVLL